LIKNLPNSSINLVEKQIEKGLSLILVDQSTDETMLMFAARVGNMALAKMIVRKGGAEDQRNSKGENAYMIAIKAENFELADFFLYVGSDPNSMDDQGSNVLIRAVKERNTHLIPKLV